MLAGDGVEGLACVAAPLALVVLDQRDDVGRAGISARSGVFVGKNSAGGAVGGLEVRRPDALHVGRLHGAQAVAMQEQQPPVAHAGPVAQREADVLGVVQLKLDLLEDLGARALHFFVGDRLRRRLLGTSR